MKEPEREVIKRRVWDKLETDKNSKSYDEDLEKCIKQEMKWPKCPKCGDYLDTQYIDGYSDEGDWWDNIWVCYNCPDEFGDDQVCADEDAEVFGSDFGIMEMEIKDGIWRVFQDGGYKLVEMKK